MELSRFITQCNEQIVDEWEKFARSLLPPGSEMPKLALRDHAKQILEAAAKDLDTAQSEKQRDEKSKGQQPTPDKAESAATTHGELRYLDGFSLDQLFAEFRAMRATVLRLWQEKASTVTDAMSEDMIRFNEAIDQAVAESVASFSEQTSRTRELFLAILGHDLRGPLSTMSMSGHVLSSPGLGSEQTQLVGARVKRSAATMTAMVNDLLEYSRTQLGTGIPVKKTDGDLAPVCEAAMDDARAGHPGCPFELQMSGDLHAAFDPVGLQQVLTNLLNNAAQYRSDDRSIVMRASAKADELVVDVCNHGPVLSAQALKKIFEPLVRLPQKKDKDAPPTTSLGLGLFIARQITEGHGGSVTAESSESAGTVFTVRLPRT